MSDQDPSDSWREMRGDQTPRPGESATGDGQNPYGQNPYGQDPYGDRSPGQRPGSGGPGPHAYGYAPPPNHPQSTTALVVGLISVLGAFLCLFPLLLSPWAWISGARAVREIDASGGRMGGRGQAQAGMILGIVGTVLVVLGIGAAVLLIVGLAASS